MAKPLPRAKPHVLARQRLLKLLRRLGEAGEQKLPGERALCKLIDVAPVTLRKVLKHLSAEGRVICVPRSGNYVGTVPEYLNIGLILGDGSTVSFLHGAPVISGIIDAGSEACVHLRTVQLREPGRARRVLADYGLDGCIWNVANPALLGQIAAAVEESDVPVVVVLAHGYTVEPGQRLPEVRVEPDFHGIGALRARCLLRRGHRAIACFTDPATQVYAGFTAEIARARGTHRPEWAFAADGIADSLPRILDQGETTALIVDGGVAEMTRVLQLVDDHPAGRRLELLLDHTGPHLAGMLVRHPRLRIAAINRYPGKELGEAALGMLLGHLQDGRPLAPIRILSRLFAVDGTPIEPSQATTDPRP